MSIDYSMLWYTPIETPSSQNKLPLALPSLSSAIIKDNGFFRLKKKSKDWKYYYRWELILYCYKRAKLRESICRIKKKIKQHKLHALRGGTLLLILRYNETNVHTPFLSGFFLGGGVTFICDVGILGKLNHGINFFLLNYTSNFFCNEEFLLNHLHV